MISVFNKIKKYLVGKELLAFVIIMTIIRLLLALFIELSNDEVYYHTFALYPDLSHFDHAPMVGWIIQLTTLNMWLHDDFFMRLGSIILSIINTYLVYYLVKDISNKKTGVISAIIFNFSFYNSIIAGFFIMPDSGMLTFWLLALWFFIKSLPNRKMTKKDGKNLIFAGIFTGLAMLSKYHAIILWFSALMYILLYNRFWLKRIELYISGIISIIVFLPVIIWNFQHDFISFTFQSDRVKFSFSKITFDNFGLELIGQFIYNNPINVLLIIFAIIILINNKSLLNSKLRMLLIFGLPLPIIFLLVSLFKTTLPHWSGPGYISLGILSTIILVSKIKIGFLNIKKSIISSGMFFVISILLILFQLAFNIIPIGYNNDPTSDITGWEQLGKQFTDLRTKQINGKVISEKHIMLANRWFPAAHLDYYIAEPNKIPLIVSGTIDWSHKYIWINKMRGGIKLNTDAYYFTTDTIRYSAKSFYDDYFEKILDPEVISITRNNKLYVNYFVYILKNYNGKKLYDDIK